MTPWYTECIMHDRHPLDRCLLPVFVLAAAAAVVAQSQVPVPVPPIRTALGSMPGVDALPARPELPDVMTMNGGQPVRTVVQWQQRREEMTRTLAYYATGLMPPAPGNVRGREIRRQAVLGGKALYRLVHLSFGPGEALGFDVAIFTPAGDGPFPMIVFPSFSPTPGGTPLKMLVRPPEQGKGGDTMIVPLGDQAARAGAVRASAPAPAAATPPPVPPSSDPEAVAATHQGLFERGYALATYHYQDAGEDTIGRTLDGRWAFRGTRVFPPYGDYDWGLLAGWAWGISRAIDFLETQPFADRTKFIAIGHSRVGKAVLVAGAFDERIALVAPAGSGAGGTGAYRFNGARGGGREGLADMMRKYPNWFSPNLYPFAQDVDRLPFDQHWLIALAAPRAFISLEGTDDQNCVPNALRQSVAGAEPAFVLTNARNKLAVHYASHRHALADEDWEALVDFADRVLMGKPVSRVFNNYPSAPWPATPATRAGPGR
jgi:hypothetical protein